MKILKDMEKSAMSLEVAELNKKLFTLHAVIFIISFEKYYGAVSKCIYARILFVAAIPQLHLYMRLCCTKIRLCGSVAK